MTVMCVQDFTGCSVRGGESGFYMSGVKPWDSTQMLEPPFLKLLSQVAGIELRTRRRRCWTPETDPVQVAAPSV